MAKHHLVIESEYDYELIGICSYSSDYHLVWEINKYLNLNFRKSNEAYRHISKKNAPPTYHSQYEYTDEETGIQYFFIKNKQTSSTLIPEKVQIDYFIFLKNNFTIDVMEWMNQLKSCPSVQAAYCFYPEEIKSCELLSI